MKRAACVLALAAVQGCVWPTDPVPVRALRFEGTVRHAVTAAPVAGARVEVWLLPPDEVAAAAPFVQGETDAAGNFAVQGSQRNRAIPFFTTLRVTPPASSGLAPKSTGGYFRDVFPDVTVYETEGRRYRTEVRLTPGS